MSTTADLRTCQALPLLSHLSHNIDDHIHATGENSSHSVLLRCMAKEVHEGYEVVEKKRSAGGEMSDGRGYQG
jgi:hypothetical protein